MRIVTEIDKLVTVRTVLASVFDKDGLEDLVPALLELCPEVKIISTGGTYKRLQEILGDDAEGRVIPINDFTGAPETKGGLVKTLSREKSLALLTETYCEEHQQDLEREKVTPIDIVLCNLYPFQEVVKGDDITPEKARMNIDIGGPNMVREAAKNYVRCASIVEPADYPELLADLRKNDGAMSFAFRLRCAGKAFDHVATYNRAIAEYFAKVGSDEALACYPEVHERGK